MFILINLFLLPFGGSILLDIGFHLIIPGIIDFLLITGIIDLIRSKRHKKEKSRE